MRSSAFATRTPRRNHLGIRFEGFDFHSFHVQVAIQSCFFCCFAVCTLLYLSVCARACVCVCLPARLLRCLVCLLECVCL